MNDLSEEILKNTKRRTHLLTPTPSKRFAQEKCRHSASKAFYQLDLTGVIQVVCRRSFDHLCERPSTRRRSLRQFSRRQRRYSCAERAMAFFEERQVGLPDAVTFGAMAIEPIAPFERKGSALFSEDPATHRVLPVGTMDDDLPDVVPIATRTPCCFTRRQPSNRSFQIGAVPGRMIVGLVEQVQEEADGAQRRDVGDW